MKSQVEAQNDLLNEVKKLARWVKIAIFMGAWWGIVIGFVLILVNLPELTSLH